MTDRPVALVLGATGTIGSQVAHNLQERGYGLVLLGRDRAKLDDLNKALSHRPVASILADATDPKSFEESLSEGLSGLDSLSCAVNTIGSMSFTPADRLTLSEYQKAIDVNITSSFLTLKLAVPKMKRAGGAVVFFSSAAASVGMASHETISMTKAALEGLARAASATYARQKIRVNVVAPGLTKTNLTEAIFKDERTLGASLATHALGRAGEPEEISRAVMFLVESEWITGTTLHIDGGLSSVRPRMVYK
ncbi:NAD(P)-dependent dehydrogenase, short-chain alcohol dehydrogenase family [Ferrithrix thermotolerans DSM 19514]|uniref:NAD(P)-dependent dehydrogenase, short-chain alcohol dehydrogenase family n=1 Tax=Ferrithrix thermotolerans DSM 19514 TaxID=1121881 RepID=A0A1M4T3D6_9ACTN|nr:SDR family oxidoreductase [Ferrithrix thermotolerans]SHE38807.1 NAD(P)-dependent dehydrogenase, short-chain alcohol dehydrogenase family [Ferrithrix thermotolerans DSM 19514]